MPNIPQVNAGLEKGGLDTQDGRAGAAVAGGRTISSLYGVAADQIRGQGADYGEAIQIAGTAAVEYLDQQEIGAGMAEASRLDLQLSQQWEKTLAESDANDPSVGARFRENVVGPALDKFAENFNTKKSQNWAQGRLGHMRDSYFKQTVADQSTKAMVASKENLRSLARTASNKVAINPASLDDTLASLDHDVGSYVDSLPTLTAQHKAAINSELLPQIKEKVVQAAVGAWMLKDPEMGLKLASDEKYAGLIDGAQVNAAYKEAKRVLKADDALARQTAREEAAKKSDANLTNFIQRLYDPDDPNKPTAKEIIQVPDEDMTPGDREKAIKLVEAETRGEPLSRTSSELSGKMLKGIREGGITKDDIFRAREENRITKEDFTFLTGMFNDYTAAGGSPISKQRTQFLSRFGKFIDTSNPWTEHVDEAGGRHLYSFEQELARRERDMRAAGKDPAALYDDKSPEFMGSVEAMAPYRKTAQENMDEFRRQRQGMRGASAAGSTVPPPRPPTLQVGDVVDGKKWVRKPNIPANWETVPTAPTGE